MRHPPYLLLDVDGVLDPFPGPSGSLPPRHRPHRVTYRGEPGIPWVQRRPLAWIDDDFTPLDHTWAKDRTDTGAVTLLIWPDPYQGLQREHIDAVRTWVIAVLYQENEERRTGDVPRPRTAAPVHTTAHTSRLHGSR